MWKELIKILAELIAAYDEIFKLGKKKHGFLVNMKFESLEPLLKEEKELADKVQILENRRQGVLVKMAGANDRLKPDMTMQQLIAFAPQPLQHTLAVIHKHLSGKVDEVVKQNEINSILAMGALDAVTKMLGKLSGAKVDGTYGKNGAESVSRRKNVNINA